MKIPILKEFEWFEWFEWFGPSPIEPFNYGPHGHRRVHGEEAARRGLGGVAARPEEQRPWHGAQRARVGRAPGGPLHAPKFILTSSENRFFSKLSKLLTF